jgi:hypothetical protein
MSARDIILAELPCNIVYGRGHAVDGILSALTAAGYRLIGPGELGAIEMALDYAKRPLANDLEIGFRHGELSPKEKLERYAETCACIEHDLSAALRSLQGGEDA